MLDERLALAASLYEPCELGADIGTDHGYLPCWLLEHSVCRKMLLCDISPKALQHARDNIAERGLQNSAEFQCADGLSGLSEPCGCVSITGMGGETMAQILLEGREKLHGAVLVLSAHTEPQLVRKAVAELGYHFTQERICRSAGRFYLLWRA